MEVHVSAHAVCRIQYHIVWSTKYRHRALDPVVFKKRTEEVIKDIASRVIGVEIVELNAQADHVQMVAIIPPIYAVARLIEIIKEQSAKVVRKEIHWLD